MRRDGTNRSRPRLLGSLVGLLVLASPVRADSVFAIRGFGLLQSPQSLRARAMGGTGVALWGEDFSFTNPALTAGFSRSGLTLVSLSEVRRAEDPLRESDTDNFDVPLLHLVFPVSSRLVLDLGFHKLLDFGWVVQDTVSREDLTEEPIPRRFVSDGSLSILQAGVSHRLTDRLAWGAGLQVYTGSNVLGLEMDFPREFTPVRSRAGVEFTGLGGTFGLLYRVPGRVTAGAAVETGTSLDVDPGEGVLLREVEVATEEVDLPLRLRGGVAVPLNAAWRLAAEGEWSPWTDLEIDGRSAAETTDHIRLGLGAEWTPQNGPLFISRELPLRMGVAYRRLPRLVNGETVNEFTLSVGLGHELGDRRIRLDLSLEAGQRGSLDENRLEERFLRLGVSFSGFERWQRAPRRGEGR